MANRKNSNGNGSIYRRADGRWEGKYSVSEADGCGKYIRKSVYGKTKDEVRRQLTHIQDEIDEGSYVEESNYKFSEWLDVWLEYYVKNAVKSFTYDSYLGIVNNYIKPALGGVKIKELKTTQIQRFYNHLLMDCGLSGKTVKNIHGVVHRSLEQAYLIDEIRSNPSKKCTLPRTRRPEIEPLEFDDIQRFLHAIKGHKYENVYYLTLFSGLRQGEVLGLTWKYVDFENNCITICKQLKRTTHHKGAEYVLDCTKNGRSRSIALADSVIDMLKRQKEWQESCAVAAGSAWNNAMGLVFTNELGGHLCHSTVYNNYKRIVKELGLENKRFHDLRHTYAVAAIESGDDIKTIQGNLGHSTASFTLDVYGHVTKSMRQSSAAKMQDYINRVS